MKIVAWLRIHKTFTVLILFGLLVALVLGLYAYSQAIQAIQAASLAYG